MAAYKREKIKVSGLSHNPLSRVYRERKNLPVSLNMLNQKRSFTNEHVGRGRRTPSKGCDATSARRPVSALVCRMLSKRALFGSFHIWYKKSGGARKAPQIGEGRVDGDEKNVLAFWSVWSILPNACQKGRWFYIDPVRFQTLSLKRNKSHLKNNSNSMFCFSVCCLFLDINLAGSDSTKRKQNSRCIRFQISHWQWLAREPWHKHLIQCFMSFLGWNESWRESWM